MFRLRSAALAILLLLLLPQTSHASIIINELLPDPSDETDQSEWIELYSSSDQVVNLTGYSLDDEEDEYQLNHLTIEAHSFIIVHKQDSHIKLNNQGELVKLLRHGQLVDQVEYSKIPTDQSYGRIPDGSGNWQTISHPSPGNVNSGGEENANSTPSPTENYSTPLPIKLSEVYPCPSKDQLEWIELHNPSDRQGTITGWTIVDAGNHRLEIPVYFQPDGHVTIDIKTPMLNNTGDTVSLIDAGGKTVHQMHYENCQTDTSFIESDGYWILTTTPTKAKPNKLTEPAKSTKNANQKIPETPVQLNKLVEDSYSDDISSLSLFLNGHNSIASDTANSNAPGHTYTGTVAGIVALSSRSAEASPASPIIFSDANHATPLILAGAGILFTAAIAPVLKKLKLLEPAG